MIALSSADDAVQLANDIQSDLLNAEWPMELASMPSSCVEFPHMYHRGSEPLQPTFRGLRVRIGVHCGEHGAFVEEGGEVTVQYDEVAKGYDYYGPAVNTAARIESVGFGGQTLISSEVHSRLSTVVKKGCHLKSMGGFSLKGLKEEVNLYQCLPKKLSQRKFFDGGVRRRDSMGISVISCFDDDTMSNTTNPQDDEQDLTADVMSLTTSQLQMAVMRLRNKIECTEKNCRRKSNGSFTIPFEVVKEFHDQDLE